MSNVVPTREILEDLRNKLTYDANTGELRWKLVPARSPGMSWDNYGNPNGDHTDCWHIDHIWPCSKFNLDDPFQQRACFHYRNLQPMWAKANISKHNKVGVEVDYE